MKTNQLMMRDEGFIQRTSDGYFSATELLKRWNRQHTDEQKQLGSYMNINSTSEYVDQLKKEGIDNPIISGKGSKAGTWVHPKVFIDLAMWVSVEFKSKVIDYVLDGLIKSRHDAGDYYNEMCAVILDTYIDHFGCKPAPAIYIREANMIRSLVATKDRNNMDENELRQLTYLQKFNAMLLKKKIGKDSRIRLLQQAAEVSI
jgi:hypothetical protein